VESQGPLATIWVGLGLIAFYIALIWINTLLGVFLTPLFLIPLTHLRRRRQTAPDDAPTRDRPVAARR
jgi:hypothetical protein